MNVAFFVTQLNQDQRNLDVYNALNEEIESGAIDNGSIFYKEPGHIPMEPRFSMFNSTDIWHYTGTLIATSMETFLDAAKAINKFTLAYLFSKDDSYSTFSLIGISKQTKILTSNEEDHREVYRLTGVKPILLENLKPSTIEKALQ
jgi:hypothetical protein